MADKRQVFTMILMLSTISIDAEKRSLIPPRYLQSFWGYAEFSCCCLYRILSGFYQPLILILNHFFDFVWAASVPRKPTASIGRTIKTALGG